VKHFLITKINLESSLWIPRLTKRMGYLRFNDDYLNNMLELFGKYTVPAVESQSCQEFTWLVFIHKDTKDEWKEKFRNKVDNLIEVTKDKDIKHHIDRCDQDIITTNLDSDDSISIDYLSEIQSFYYKNKKDLKIPSVISYYSGFLLSETRQLIAIQVHIYNPFISLVESGKDIKTVSFYKHNSIENCIPALYKVSDKGMWMSVCHDKNIVNRLRKQTRHAGLLKVSDIYEDNVFPKYKGHYLELRRFKF